MAAREREWARIEAVPEIHRLLGVADTLAAYGLATRAQQALPDDPTIAGLLDAASSEVDIDSQPAGALVSYRPYDGGDWVPLGITPLSKVRVPFVELAVRFELAGFAPHTLGALPLPGQPMAIRLSDAESDGDQVWVPEGTFALGSEPVALDEFRIDRTEVTNAEYQRFVDDGGYDGAAWATLDTGGNAIDVDRAAAEFRDATGQPGPAGWELSRHAAGVADHPVRGVSWFEAATFCASRSKALPTFYHWKHAAGIEVRDRMLAASNVATRLSATGPVAVGSSEAFGVNGVVDMAGNVREWVWNASREGRYLLGGGWDAPTYLYVAYEAIDPWDRDPTNGFRCATYDAPPASETTGPIAEPFFDFKELPPVDDETFAAYTRFYDYDPIDLDPRSSVVETTGEWTYEFVEITAAYPEERVPLHVFLPANAEPPYQTVVYFPGASAFALSSSTNLAERSQLMFLPRSGRALIYPVLKHTYERRTPDAIATPTFRRRRAVAMAQDIMRAVDYAVERSELDGSKVAYMGSSYGAELAVPVALEKRFQALVLVGAALDAAWLGSTPEEAAPWNFVSRITTPTILINGDADVMHPYAEGQVPFFNAIDVPDTDKRFVVSSGGHRPPWNDVIRQTLDWLDERLGPVSTVRR